MKKILTFIMLFVSLFTVLAVATTPQAEAASKTIYLKPSSNWLEAGAIFYGHFWGGSGDEDVKFTDADGNGIYEATVNKNPTKVIFTRNQPGSTGPWNNEWGRIETSVPTDGKNQFNIVGWATSASSWTTYVHVVPDVTLVGSFKQANWDLNYEDFTFEEDNGVYTLENVELSKGTYEFKLAINHDWAGPYAAVTVKNSGTYTMTIDAGTNATIEANGGYYNFKFTLSSKQLVVEHIPYIHEQLKSLISDYYGTGANNGVYVRTTQININEAAKEEMSQYFHNAGSETDAWANLQANRTTNFCGNYLYFNEGNKTGFGTSSNGTLTSFTWNGSYDNSQSVGNAIDDYFVTLKDFAELTNNSSNAGAKDVDLSTGWTYAEGVYTCTKEANSNVIDAAKAFTAPGWKDAGKYIDFTQVTVEVVDGDLVISLWVSSADAEGKLVNYTTVDTNSVFSYAKISK